MCVCLFMCVLLKTAPDAQGARGPTRAHVYEVGVCMCIYVCVSVVVCVCVCLCVCVMRAGPTMILLWCHFSDFLMFLKIPIN